MIIELTQDWGNRLLEGTNKTSCTPRPRRKEQGPPQETDPDSPVSVQESPAEVWVGSRLLQSGSLTLWQATVDPRLHWRLLNPHRQVWLSLLWGHCSFLLGPGAKKILFVPANSLCFLSLV